MTNSDIGMYDWKPIIDTIKVGNGTKVKGLKIGKLKVNVVQSNGKISTLVLSNIKYVSSCGATYSGTSRISL